MAHYIAALLTYTRNITDPFLKRMETDYQQLCDFFEKSCPKERVSDIRLLSALTNTLSRHETVFRAFAAGEESQFQESLIGLRDILRMLSCSAL